MMWLEIMGMFMMIVGGSVVCRSNKHLLSLFIGLEMMSLGVLFMSHVLLINEFWLILLILCLAVCEASVCLALLVMVMRLNGSDLMSSLSCNNA